MGIFKTDPAEALRAARDQLEKVAAEAAKLQGDRAAALEAGGDGVVAAVMRIDTDLRRLDETAGIYRGRVEVLERQIRDQQHERREQARVAAIANVAKRLGRRAEAAGRLDRALKEVCDALADLDRQDDMLFKDWSPLLQSPDLLRHCRASVLMPLSARRIERTTAGVVREVVDRGPYDLTAAVQQADRDLMTELEGTPLPAAHEAEAA